MWRRALAGFCLAWVMVGALAANPGVEVGTTVVLVTGAKSLAKIEQTAGSAKQQPNAAVPPTLQLRGLKANGGNVDSAIWGPFPLEARAVVDVELQA